MSVPSSKLLMPVATAAAAPPDDPPGTRLWSHGLLVVPNSSLKVWTSPDHSGRFVRPSTTTPARRSAAAAGASSVGTYALSTIEPPVDRQPASS